MRDAAEDIEACLMSLKGLVDEFVVVDTGSLDDSVARAERIVGNVYRYPWREDFSAAKNYAIEKSEGEWIIFLDADEALTEGTRKNLPDILRRYGGPGGPDAMSVLRYNVTVGGREPLGENYAERIFRRELRYRDTIHEYLAYEDGRKKKGLDLPPRELAIWHTGYSPERMAEKTARNMRMLEAEREKGSGKKFLYYYLAGLYLHEKEYGKAAEAAWESIGRGDYPERDPTEIYRICYEAEKELGHGEEGLRVLRRGMEDHPLRPDCFALCGDFLWDAGESREAYDILKKALKKMKDFSGHFPGERHFLSDAMDQVYRLMAKVCESLGKKGEAGKYRKKAARESKGSAG